MNFLGVIVPEDSTHQEFENVILVKAPQLIQFEKVRVTINRRTGLDRLA